MSLFLQEIARLAILGSVVTLNLNRIDQIRSTMDAQTVLAVLPGHGPHQRLRVALVRGANGRRMIELREQHYAEGIGWFDQRTLSLDPRQFKQLRAILGAKESAWEDAAVLPMTIPFPAPAERAPRRVASGE